MSRILMFLCVAVVLFGLAAGASWYLQDQHHDDGTKTAEDKGGKHAANSHGKGANDAASQRPLVRAPLSPEAEKITQIATSLQTQQDSLKSREQAIVVREKQIELIFEETKKEQKKVEAMRKEVDVELQLVQEKLDALEKRNAEGENTRKNTLAALQEMQDRKLEIDGTRSKNLKQLATTYDKMDPEQASQSFQQMVEQGKLDTAVAIIANMRNSAAANLLSEISKLDVSVANQIVDRISYLKTPAAAK